MSPKIKYVLATSQEHHEAGSFETVGEATEFLASLGTTVHVSEHAFHAHEYAYQIQNRATGLAYILVLDFSEVNGGKEFRYED